MPELFDKKDWFEKTIESLEDERDDKISEIEEERDNKISEIEEEYSDLLEEPQAELATVEGKIDEKCKDLDDDISSGDRIFILFHVSPSRLAICSLRQKLS